MSDVAFSIHNNDDTEHVHLQLSLYTVDGSDTQNEIKWKWWCLFCSLLDGGGGLGNFSCATILWLLSSHHNVPPPPPHPSVTVPLVHCHSTPLNSMLIMMGTHQLSSSLSWLDGPSRSVRWFSGTRKGHNKKSLRCCALWMKFRGDKLICGPRCWWWCCCCCCYCSGKGRRESKRGPATESQPPSDR